MQNGNTSVKNNTNFSHLLKIDSDRNYESSEDVSGCLKSKKKADLYK